MASKQYFYHFNDYYIFMQLKGYRDVIHIRGLRPSSMILWITFLRKWENKKTKN